MCPVSRQTLVQALVQLGVPEDQLTAAGGLEDVLRQAGLSVRARAARGAQGDMRYPKPKTRLAAWLIVEARARGWRLGTLAQKIGLPEAAAGRMLSRGEGDLTVDMLLRISSALGFSPLRVLAEIDRYDRADAMVMDIATRVASLAPDVRLVIENILDRLSVAGAHEVRLDELGELGAAPGVDGQAPSVSAAGQASPALVKASTLSSFLKRNAPLSQHERDVAIAAWNSAYDAFTDDIKSVRGRESAGAEAIFVDRERLS